MKSILITGASGFLGRNFILDSYKDFSITAVYNKSKDFPKWVKRKKIKNIKILKIDLSNQKLVRKHLHLRDYDFVIHLASLTNTQYDNDKDNYNNIYLTTKNIVDNITCKAFIYFSTTGVYGFSKGTINEETPLNPKIPYTKYKVKSEEEVFNAYKKGMCGHYFIIRLNGGFGPYEHPRKATYRLLKDIIINKGVTFEIYGNGRNLVDLLYSEDIISAIKKVIKRYNKAPVGAYNLSKCKPITITDLVKFIPQVFKREPIKITYKGKTQEPTMFKADSSKFRGTFDWRPRVSLHEGLSKEKEWLDGKK